MNHRLRTPAARQIFSFIAIIVITGLAGASALCLKASLTQDESHTINYLHCSIYTNAPQHPWAQAFAVRDGKITCIGTISHVVLECAAGEARVQTVELHGKFVMPGFNDAHVHLGYAGAGMLAVRLYGAASIDELKKRVAAGVARR